MRPVQRFTDEQLAHSRTLTPEQVLGFLEDFRQLHATPRDAGRRTSTAISVRVPDTLLRLFRHRAEALGVPYQTQIKRLMEQWAAAKKRGQVHF